MLVRDIMNHPVTTVAPSASLGDAFALMHEHNVRHLPVMDDHGRVVGIITDRDIRYATSELTDVPLPRKAEVSQAMSAPAITASPLDPVEDAAQRLRTERIGALPIVEGADLVGIITGTDLLDAVVRLTGVEKPGSRLAVALPDKPGQLARLTARVADAGLDIRSVLSYYTPSSDATDTLEDPDDASYLHVILRVDTIHIRPLAQELRDEGFNVLWPLPKPTAQ